MDVYELIDESIRLAYDSCCYDDNDLDVAMYEYVESALDDAGYRLTGRIAKMVETEIAEYIFLVQNEEAA